MRAARLGAGALLCPANLAPVAHPRTSSSSTTRRRCAIPAGTRAATPPRSGGLLPLIARARAARHHGLGVLARRADRAARARAGARQRRARRGRPRLLARRPTRERARAALGLERPYVLCVASHTARKNLAALVPAARGARRRGDRRRRRRRPPAPVRRRGRARRAAAARPRPRPAAAGALRRRRGVRAPVALRGLRAAGAGGDGGRDAGRGRRRRRAARRRAAAPRGSSPPEGDAFRDALLALLGDGAERARLRAAGLARARAFTWDATARAVDAVVRAHA